MESLQPRRFATQLPTLWRNVALEFGHVGASKKGSL